MGLKICSQDAFERAMKRNERINRSDESNKYREPTLAEQIARLDKLEEEQRQKMIKMVEDILTKKNKSESDIISKSNPISKILVKNIESIKKIADKEGISVNELIKILKSNE